MCYSEFNDIFAAIAALKALRPGQLWINPDCGLKMRNWPETLIALKNMCEAAKQLRVEFAEVTQPSF